MKKETEDMENKIQKIVLGTSNPHKLEEIKEIIKGSRIEFVLPPEGFDPDENGKTFEENSFIKAAAASKISGDWGLADDTGLCVDALNGAPGLYSARYAPTPAEKINKLLFELKDVPPEKRTAKFVCTMVLTNPKGEKIHVQTGEIKGLITDKPAGIHGFGYDPIFYIPVLGKTMAELSLEEKNTLSHRALALLPMMKFIET